MIITLMYHRVTNTRFSYDPLAFENHLTYLAENYKIVIPGEQVPFQQLALCLTFDDAYYDFYHVVFPLLKKLNIKVLLAIPTHLIIDKTDLTSEQRLSISYENALEKALDDATLCTWEEIKEMVDSGLVIPASHAASHTHLTNDKVDLYKEIVESKKLLSEKTGYLVSTFVYPYGRMNKTCHQLVKKHYDVAMRIGSSLNVNWNNLNGIHYRIDAEKIWPTNKKIFKMKQLLKYSLRFVNNLIRNK